MGAVACYLPHYRLARIRRIQIDTITNRRAILIEGGRFIPSSQLHFRNAQTFSPYNSAQTFHDSSLHMALA